MSGSKLRIWYQNPVPFLDAYQGLHDLLKQTLGAMGREGTEIDNKWQKGGYADPTHAFTMAYSALHQALGVRSAQKEGYDAVVIGNSLDIGLREARSITDIIVTGVTESALHVASSLGNRYAFVVIHNGIAQLMDNLVRAYGMGDRLARIAHLGISLSEAASLYGDPEELVRLFSEKASRTIAESGAEVIIPGCTILSSFLNASKIYEIDGVPVIDPVWAGVKMAEVMVDLRKSYGIGVCRASIYRAYPEWEKEIRIDLK